MPQTGHPDPGSWDTAGDSTRLKPKFLTRWSVQGRTQDALYAKWQGVSFHTRKDDSEEFMIDIKNIASQLNYPHAAQLMAIKGMLPIEIYNTCLNIDTLNDLKDLLIKVFDNPRIKNRNAAAKDSEPSGSTFSMVKNVDTSSPGAATEMGELISKIYSIELSLQSLNNKGPYTARVSPKQTRPFNHKPWQFQNDRRSPKTPPEIPIIIIQNRDQNNRRGQAEFINHRRGRFHTSSNVRCPRVASRIPDKDKLHCHYSQEIGHLIKDFRKLIRYEKNVVKFSLLGGIPEDWLYAEEDPSLDSDIDSNTDPMDDLNIFWS